MKNSFFQKPLFAIPFIAAIMIILSITAKKIYSNRLDPQVDNVEEISGVKSSPVKALTPADTITHDKILSSSVVTDKPVSQRNEAVRMATVIGEDFKAWITGVVLDMLSSIIRNRLPGDLKIKS